MITSRGEYTRITDRHTAVMFPTFGCQVDEGHAWRIHIAGAVYEPGVIKLQQRLMLRVLRQVMDVAPEALETPVFRDRIAPFSAASGGGKWVTVRAGSEVVCLRQRTRRNGHFLGSVRLPAELVEPMLSEGWLDLNVMMPAGDERLFGGNALLLPDSGLSVISDIDDTIKHTEVGSRRELLANTFLRAFRAVDGMAELYRTWALQGAAFHYVSSSPWQLYQPLAELRRKEGFPLGTFHLRPFRLRDHMLRRMLMFRRPGKGAEIRRIVATFPQRRFILIGDSAELDPELYGAVARRYPQRVQAIYIRRVGGRPWTAQRAHRAFRGLPVDMWRVFDDPSQIPVDLAASAGPCQPAADRS